MASNRTKGAAVGGALVALVGGAEGLRQNAYPDPATHGKPWTICYGHTGDVHPGDKFSLDECKALLLTDLEEYAKGVEKCVPGPLTDGQYVAFVSFAFNVGVGTFCKSGVARLTNSGQPKAGCDNLLKYNRAAGVVFPGLTKRRERERAYCLRDL